MRQFFLIVLFVIGVCVVMGDNPPALPSGLPSGLGEEPEPSLPTGLFGEASKDAPRKEAPVEKRKSVPVTGFIETRLGTRLQDDPFEDSSSLMEVRMQLQNRGRLGVFNYRLSGDLLMDALAETQSIDFKKGEGWLDVREAWVSGQLSSSIDFKLGRQIATWGTGDLLFINDLFPKDYKSFLLGRDEEYLKAPMNSVRLSYFSNLINLDLVYTPEFAPDRYISGEHLSYYDPSSGGLVGQNSIVDPVFPTGDEIAFRAHRLIGPAEVSFYFYNGYWKSPAGQDLTGEAIFPQLRVMGASWRQPILGGIGYAEFGHYDSLDDSGGTNAQLRNSEWRWLLGFEHELGRDLTGGFQVYQESIQNYGNYLASLPPGAVGMKQNRTVLTIRLTQLAMNQNLLMSLMAFYSPSNNDYYLRPKIQYSIDDQWKIEMGGNLFGGKQLSSFYGQFENNTNIYTSLKFSF